MQIKNCFYIMGLLILASSTGCTGNNTSTLTQNSEEDTTKLPPVETKQPNSPEYKPAFEGQTRIAGVKTTTPYTVEKIAENLDEPWAVVPFPDGRLFITMRSGHMEIHDTAGALIKKITGFPPVVHAGQGGLLDV